MPDLVPMRLPIGACNLIVCPGPWECLQAEAAKVPGKLTDLLASGDLQWRPGLRVLSPAVVAKKFDKQYVIDVAPGLSHY